MAESLPLQCQLLSHLDTGEAEGGGGLCECVCFNSAELK